MEAAAARLLARASDTYAVSAGTLAPRINAAVGKYLLRDNAESSLADLNDFVDKLQADDLCLIVACEQGNEKAWTDLVARFGSTVRSAARSSTDRLPISEVRRFTRSFRSRDYAIQSW